MIILVILKWIGIVLLCLLGVALAILLQVLFIPIRYRISGSFMNDVPQTEAKAQWMMVQLMADWRRVPDSDSDKNKITAVLKVFGITVKTLIGGEEETAEEHPSENMADDTAEEIRPPENDELPREEAPNAEIADTVQEDLSDTGSSDHTPENSPEETAEDLNAEEEGLFTGFLNRIKASWEDFSSTAKAVYRVIQKKKEAVGKLYGIYTAPKNQTAIRFLKKQAMFLLNEIRPRKGNGKARIGTGDPYTTGQVMQAAAFLYPVFGDHIEVIPDFENAVHDIEGDIRGRCRLGFLLWYIITVMVDKRLKKMYHQTKKTVQEELL